MLMGQAGGRCIDRNPENLHGKVGHDRRDIRHDDGKGDTGELADGTMIRIVPGRFRLPMLAALGIADTVRSPVQRQSMHGRDHQHPRHEHQQPAESSYLSPRHTHSPYTYSSAIAKTPREYGTKPYGLLTMRYH
jgi:hypothetical protein